MYYFILDRKNYNVNGDRLLLKEYQNAIKYYNIYYFYKNP